METGLYVTVMCNTLFSLIVRPPNSVSWKHYDPISNYYHTSPQTTKIEESANPPSNILTNPPYYDFWSKKLISRGGG